MAAKLPSAATLYALLNRAKKSETILQRLPLFLFLFIDQAELLFSNCAVNQAW